MEKSRISPNASQLTAEEEAALASEVLKIIGGVSFRSVPTPEEAEEKEGWSLEEGDDSVFYSDEEQARREDLKDTGSCTFGGNKYQRLVNSEAEEEAIRHGEDADVDSDKENSENEREHQTQQMTVSDTDWDPNPQKTGNTVHVETLPEHNTSTETGNLHAKAEEVLQDAHTSNINLLGAFNERSHKTSNGEPEVLKHLHDHPLQLQLEAEGKSSSFPVAFHRHSGSGYSTLPLMIKPDHSSSLQGSFDHLTSSKYSTVSYRRIRRGNTRQKIEEFECIIKNL